MEDHIVYQKAEIIGTPLQVWDALTNPEKTKEYFFHCAVHSDWQVGSEISFKGKIFFIKDIEMKGRIVDIERERLLKYTLANASDHSGTCSTVTDELSYSNGITTVAVTDDVGVGEGVKERYERSVKGWEKVLKGLKRLVEAENKTN